MTRFLYGTSSWSEKSWVGSFYPDRTAPADYLRYYATQFQTVEADVTYYRVPDRKLVEGWAAKTPDGFVLSAKFPRSIVHGGDGARPEAATVLRRDAVARDLDQFLESMSLLGPKCGPLVLQFPYFNRSVFPAAGSFFERLDAFLGALPKHLRYAVEVRNKHWIDGDLLEILHRHAAALCLVDLAYMPHPAFLAQKHDLATTDFVYARLIGDRQAVEARTERFDRVVLDQGPRLERWSDLLRRFFGRVTEVYCYANNHYAGHGPATIRDLQRRIAAAAERSEPAP